MPKFLISADVRAALGPQVIRQLRRGDLDEYRCPICGELDIADTARPASVLVARDGAAIRIGLGHPRCVSSQVIDEPGLTDRLLERLTDAYAFFGLLPARQLPFLLFESAAQLLTPHQAKFITGGYVAKGFSMLEGPLETFDPANAPGWVMALDPDEHLRVRTEASEASAYETAIGSAPSDWLLLAQARGACMVVTGSGLGLDRERFSEVRFARAVSGRRAVGAVLPVVNNRTPISGHVLPSALTSTWDGSVPLLLVDLAFESAQGLEPVSVENWQAYCASVGLNVGRPDVATPHDPLTDWQIELGPYVAVRRVLEPQVGYFGLVSDPSWERAVERQGGCVVEVRGGVEPVLPSSPSLFAGGFVSHAGTYRASLLGDLRRYHAVLLDPDGKVAFPTRYTFILDTDVVIDIERGYFSPTRLGGSADELRQLLLNLAYHDVLPGMALQQLTRPGRRSENAPASNRASRALAATLGRSRAETEAWFSAAGGHSVPDPSVLDEGGPGLIDHPRVQLVKYAGVLKMRLLWDPTHTLPMKVSAFLDFIEWLRADLRLADAYLIQVALNLWVGRDQAARQVARLLRFRTKRVTRQTLDRLWGTATDIFLLASQDSIVATIPDAGEPVIITADAGVRDLRRFIRPLGVREVASELGVRAIGVVGLDATLHPSLLSSREVIHRNLSRLQSEAMERVRRSPSEADEPPLLRLIEALEASVLALGLLSNDEDP